MEKINFVNNQAPALSAENLNQMQTNIENAIESLYPIGSIYMSTVSTNPNMLFGFGTWELWGAGKVPVGVDTTDTAFNTVEKTGGEKTHTLTIDEMPSHTHTPNLGATSMVSGGSNEVAQISGSRTYGYLSLEKTGGSQAHNNLQPYITCYMWKRTF